MDRTLYIYYAIDGGITVDGIQHLAAFSLTIYVFRHLCANGQYIYELMLLGAYVFVTIL
jgi:hypothetical protein